MAKLKVPKLNPDEANALFAEGAGGIIGSILTGGLGAGLGLAMPLTVDDYVDKYDRNATDPAWKYGLLNSLTSPLAGAILLGNKNPKIAALQALTGGLAGGAGGYGYGLTRESEGNKR
jgi:hypothetical protein